MVLTVKAFALVTVPPCIFSDMLSNAYANVPALHAVYIKGRVFSSHVESSNTSF